MGQLANISSSSVGRLGLMTAGPGTDSPLDIARVATNAVVERSGRISARQALNDVTLSSGAFAANVRAMTETVRKDGSVELVIASDSNFHVYNKTANSLVTLVGVNAVTSGNWQIWSDNNRMIASQDGVNLEGFARDGSGNWATSAITNKAAWTDSKYGVSHIAFGRAWVANRSDEKSIVYGSVILNPLDFNSAGSGQIDLSTVWANGMDEIVAISSHANYLILFGKTQIVLYSMPTDLSITGMALVEVIKNAGCISKYTVQSTGTDIVWLSQQGVMSLGRLTQVIHLPIGNISKNVHFDLISKIVGYTTPSQIRGVYQRDMQNYILFFGDTTAYCFSLRQRTDEDGAAVSTTWDSLPATYTAVFTRDGTFYTGGALGMLVYSGYTATTYPYNLEWISGYSDFGDPSLLKFLKRLHFRALGAAAQLVTFKWAWDFKTSYFSRSGTITSSSSALSEWNVAEWGLGEWSVGAQVGSVHVPASGSGTILQIGITAPINGSELTFYSLDVMLTPGKRTGGV